MIVYVCICETSCNTCWRSSSWTVHELTDWTSQSLITIIEVQNCIRKLPVFRQGLVKDFGNSSSSVSVVTNHC